MVGSHRRLRLGDLVEDRSTEQGTRGASLARAEPNCGPGEVMSNALSKSIGSTDAVAERAKPFLAT
ncbi:hypothetical protein MesoLj131c_16410 [Mesorhizobium sp. 131-3-5]|nr:hypothetical protein MesoLj131c_16410 [Mesorhizobium sp. 131-3-5]